MPYPLLVLNNAPHYLAQQGRHALFIERGQDEQDRQGRQDTQDLDLKFDVVIFQRLKS